VNDFSRLKKELFHQPFGSDGSMAETLDECKRAAALYARRENVVAVLSDLLNVRSYIFYGGLAERLGIGRKGVRKEISSVWEGELFQRINEDDLTNKHACELRFFHLLKGMEVARRGDFYMTVGLRMTDKDGVVLPVRHRISYVANLSDGTIWLAQCLYGIDQKVNLEGWVVDTATGESVPIDSHECADMLSNREIEVLKLIQKGFPSKQIAERLSISINTVSRHRQNILGKLQASNSVEACRVAHYLALI